MTEAAFNALGYNNNGVKSFCCDQTAISVMVPMFCDW